MEIKQSIVVGPQNCPYISNNEKYYTYFIAFNVSQVEMDLLLSTGWRHFGYTFFKPDCKRCMKCTPIRINTNLFKPTKSQRRIINKNINTKFKLANTSLTNKIIEIYYDHTIKRFNEMPSETFLSDIILQNYGFTYQCEYYFNNTIGSIDFIDITTNSINSIYCIYHSKYNKLSPGNYSILYEIEFAKKIGKKYLYIGYYIEGNKVMEYKIRFHPFEWYSWEDNKWYEEPIIQ